MIKEIKLAKVNLTMESGTILNWMIREGDFIKQDEVLLEVETDKASVEVLSFYTGYIKKILFEEGEEIPVDTVIAYIGDEDDEYEYEGDM
jgi:pyruvate dehydrogenase E2 component (dihydrolipoamide acetyltransferase)